MYVASFESRKQLDCFLNELKDSIKTRSHYYVASHDHVNFKRNFTWCRKGNTTIDDDLWFPGKTCPSRKLQVVRNR
ncbi:UNVERIFIED_CONTAM: hypothetical protein B566_EDAN018005 [Ephemera danica]|nr:hypothetical protein B566_EDAN018005 [Ephemera danica]